MKAVKECQPCLGRLVKQAAGMATADAALRAKTMREALGMLDREFSLGRPSIAMATPLQRLIRAVTNNPDPYSRMKDAEIAMSRQLSQSLKANLNGDLNSILSFAVLGNSIDFFKDIASVREDLRRPVEFAVDHIAEFEKRLESSRRLLYLADNAGEVYFDSPLVDRLGEITEITYVVKESPVQNDITLSDLKRYGLADRFPRVITTGTDTPGVDIAEASAEFLAAFEKADLILAKGMGYWETLSELPARGNILHLLKAKCTPVADSLGVSLNDYVALLR